MLPVKPVYQSCSTFRFFAAAAFWGIFCSLMTSVPDFFLQLWYILAPDPLNNRLRPCRGLVVIVITGLPEYQQKRIVFHYWVLFLCAIEGFFWWKNVFNCIALLQEVPPQLYGGTFFEYFWNCEAVTDVIKKWLNDLVLIKISNSTKSGHEFLIVTVPGKDMTCLVCRVPWKQPMSQMLNQMIMAAMSPPMINWHRRQGNVQ